MRIKDIRLMKKSLEISKKTMLKAYLTGVVFSLFITLIPSLIIYNLTVFYSLYSLIVFLIAIDIFLFIFFMLYFKDKALLVYVEGYKEIEYKKLLMVYSIAIFILLIIIAFIYVRLFRWW